MLMSPSTSAVALSAVAGSASALSGAVQRGVHVAGAKGRAGDFQPPLPVVIIRSCIISLFTARCSWWEQNAEAAAKMICPSL